MKSRTMLVLLALSSGQGTAVPSDADAVAKIVQQDFARCGVSVKLSHTLSLAALDLFKGFTTQQALDRQQYRPHTVRAMRFTYNGNLQALTRALRDHCADRLGYREFGLVSDTQTVYIIAATPARVDLQQSQRWMSEFLAVTNKARFQGQKCGGVLMNAVPALRWDERLAGATARHATDMVRLNFRGHVNPVDQSRAQQRSEALGFQGVAGENIQYGAVTPQEALKELLGSPVHCANLMDPHWTRFGGAVTNGTAKTLFPTYWVQVFGAER